jgi:hypothetical protein
VADAVAVVPYDLIGGVDRVTLRGTIQLLGVAPIRDALISGRPSPAWSTSRREARPVSDLSGRLVHATDSRLTPARRARLEALAVEIEGSDA